MFQREKGLVPGAGIEPARANLAHRILSPMRLPVPPSRHLNTVNHSNQFPLFCQASLNFS